jgi:hypothetical protein
MRGRISRWKAERSVSLPRYGERVLLRWLSSDRGRSPAPGRAWAARVLPVAPVACLGATHQPPGRPRRQGSAAG